MQLAMVMNGKQNDSSTVPRNVNKIFFAVLRLNGAFEMIGNNN